MFAFADVLIAMRTKEEKQARAKKRTQLQPFLKDKTIDLLERFHNTEAEVRIKYAAIGFGAPAITFALFAIGAADNIPGNSSLYGFAFLGWLGATAISVPITRVAANKLVRRARLEKITETHPQIAARKSDRQLTP